MAIVGSGAIEMESSKYVNLKFNLCFECETACDGYVDNNSFSYISYTNIENDMTIDHMIKRYRGKQHF